MSESSRRTYDLVLWGATGFVGRLTAEYLARDARATDADKLRWAIAGRNRAKLEALRDELADVDAALADLDILVGDSRDRASLDAITEETHVVCTTVGPYAKYGSELVASCVAHGTDYCDLTGEPQWIRRMIDEHHDEATQTGARIVHCCGFDSIPSDLGALMLQEYALAELGRSCDEIKFYVKAARGGLSGGTLASMSNLMEEAAKDHDILRVVGHPYSLNPPDERHGPDGSVQQGPRYDRDIDAWTGPFVMATVNEKIVRRSNALLGFRYGREFRYAESTRMGKGIKGAVGAGGFAAGMGGFAGLMAIKPTRKLLEKFALPSPGEGPSRDKIEGGFFEVELFGRGRADDGSPFELTGRVHADKDPGYGATAIMLGEAALCLAFDEAPAGLPGGVLTPASAMGMRLVERLREAGLIFSVQPKVTH